MAVGLGLAAPALGVTTSAPDSGSESAFVSQTNSARADSGLAPLRVADDLTSIARQHAEAMAAQQRLFDDPNIGQEVQDWQSVGENSGKGASVDAVQSGFMASAPHRANILGGYRDIGVGVVWTDSTLWVAEVFRQPQSTAPAPGPAPPSGPPAGGVATGTVPAAAPHPVRPVTTTVVHPAGGGAPAPAATSAVPAPSVAPAPTVEPPRWRDVPVALSASPALAGRPAAPDRSPPLAPRASAVILLLAVLAATGTVLVRRSPADPAGLDVARLAGGTADVTGDAGGFGPPTSLGVLRGVGLVGDVAGR